uniref:Transcriptional regulator EFH1-like n=1 Tax=Diabrotica virgifera virgifera TaxID=50390 RepID=A0A6P7GF77_DIAVI
MELGDDWKTCKDINECQDPSIKSGCPHGCTNFIGSYHCPKHDEIILSDAPVPDDDEYDSDDYEETDQYDDDEYDEDEYDDDKEEQEKESSTKSVNNKDKVQENRKKIEKKIDTIYDDEYDDEDDDDDTYSASKITPKHLHKVLDSSCKGISPPHIKNAELVKIKTEKLHNGRHKQTEYLVAEYRCTDGYGFKEM